MALPTPLHVGQAEPTATLVEFSTGPNAGMVLLVAKNDPNLAASLSSGDVIGLTPAPVAVPTHQDTTAGGASTVAGHDTTSTVAGGSTVAGSDAPEDTI
jgi:hypothetical protein